MKKLLVFLCVVVLVFGVIGCKKSSTSDAGNNSVAHVAITGPSEENTVPSETATVPEPATILLFGSGLVCLAGIGRKKFFKKDQGKG